ncbi:ribosomal-protein-alanine N-acetyltransferase [Aggregatibacter actinomycetemcomitans]|uniref:ribosomal protein S18-alanine N-acetyltransferase n=1 Tax=Aggregatibacter actinomycetemcomitans TaxID=714 RepID=UPI0011D2EE07|nr:ribosomal protein S18-alanine N-acetyltransferase [Aggregatibacter actinomycetemcomitans]QEH45236.1 ribosomal-protein-alanine N-acetyltransferase [Aggregatibacter actinomycetemcomitans]QEH49842.1 ribosomal-protein-alanine N-acetyltransferase [Aggregatibacter actinomycetemcomitans]TYA51746.1 ribosomal-protein-alanine N-acetyltransferase [Aggregatibacter actinomycetemcomitans]TYB29845.1 ribosomal-protein-alanine N-acetyltransferase [Aggregatibacter actinomycetemcomitans]
MIHISPIEPSDFDRLYLIEQAAHAVPWSLGTLKNNQGERYLNLKIGEESRIDGFAICQTVLDEATLFNIAVDPQQQGLGLGRRLLSELMTQLKQKSILTLWLEVRESNKKAQALYDSLGFNQADIRKNYYPTADGKRENAVVMAAYL